MGKIERYNFYISSTHFSQLQTQNPIRELQIDRRKIRWIDLRLFYQIDKPSKRLIQAFCFCMILLFSGIAKKIWKNEKNSEE